MVSEPKEETFLDEAEIHNTPKGHFYFESLRIISQKKNKQVQKKKSFDETPKKLSRKSVQRKLQFEIFQTQRIVNLYIFDNKNNIFV